MTETEREAAKSILAMKLKEIERLVAELVEATEKIAPHLGDERKNAQQAAWHFDHNFGQAAYAYRDLLYLEDRT